MRILHASKFPCACFLVAMALGARTTACAADPPDVTLGTWKLNVAKSKFIPGPPFRSETRIYAALPDGVKVTIQTVDGDGKTINTEYPVNYDGKFHHVSTSGGPADAISLTRIDAYTAENQLKHGDRVVATARRVVSKDAKIMTITYNGAGPDGEHTDFVLVYDKQ